VLLALLVVVVFAGGFVGGYNWRLLHDKVKILSQNMADLTQRQDKITPKAKPEAVLLDPEDVYARARFEHDQQLKKLNGEQ
jgi:hypothetical protein